MGYRDEPEYDAVMAVVYEEVATQNGIRGFGLTDEAVQVLSNMVGDQIIWLFTLKRRTAPGVSALTT